MSEAMRSYSLTAFWLFLMIYSSTALSNVFDTGKYTTTVTTHKSGSFPSPPNPLIVASPAEAGEFSVLLLLHGFVCKNSYYSQLIQHIASHGNIVVAPQFDETFWPWDGVDTSNDIKSTAAVTNWLSEGLYHFLPPNVTPNFGKLALAGHSRGGKIAFAVALGKLNITTNLKFSALIGVDPVDGMDKGKQTPPPVLTYKPHSFDFDMPALVIGTGLGEKRKGLLFPPCAPKGVNHENFFNESKKPAWHFVATDYGHCDMLDDRAGAVLTRVCRNGRSRKPMRKFTGGVIVAFLKAYLHGDDQDLLAIIDGYEDVPAKFTFDSFVSQASANYI